MRPRARNPRRTTRAEPARNADTHNVWNPRVLLILLLIAVVVVVAGVVVVAAGGVVVVFVVREAGGQNGAKMHCIAWS